MSLRLSLCQLLAAKFCPYLSEAAFAGSGNGPRNCTAGTAVFYKQKRAKALPLLFSAVTPGWLLCQGALLFFTKKQGRKQRDSFGVPVFWILSPPGNGCNSACRKTPAASEYS
jgi:hypothetical protein